jgi:hypothetical protein
MYWNCVGCAMSITRIAQDGCGEVKHNDDTMHRCLLLFSTFLNGWPDPLVFFDSMA